MIVTGLECSYCYELYLGQVLLDLYCTVRFEAAPEEFCSTIKVALVTCVFGTYRQFSSGAYGCGILLFVANDNSFEWRLWLWYTPSLWQTATVFKFSLSFQVKFSIAECRLDRVGYS